jgi:hypothetical protein
MNGGTRYGNLRWRFAGGVSGPEPRSRPLPEIEQARMELTIDVHRSGAGANPRLRETGLARGAEKGLARIPRPSSPAPLGPIPSGAGASSS